MEEIVVDAAEGKDSEVVAVVEEAEKEIGFAQIQGTPWV